MKPLHVALIASLLFPPAAYAGQSRPAAPRSSGAVAYISVQKILTESDAAKNATREIEQARKAKTDEVNAKKKALDETRLALANAGGYFAGARRAELQKIEQRQEAELKQATEEAQKSLVELQRQVQTQLRNELARVIDQLAKDRSFDVVLNADTSLVWARNITDITNEVLERLNAATVASAQKAEPAK
jgi:Skp family chaperone for outer membrane proteins